MRLERLDHIGDRGFRHVQRCRGAAEIAGFHDTRKNPHGGELIHDEIIRIFGIVFSFWHT